MRTSLTNINNTFKVFKVWEEHAVPPFEQTDTYTKNSFKYKINRVTVMILDIIDNESQEKLTEKELALLEENTPESILELLAKYSM